MTFQCMIANWNKMVARTFLPFFKRTFTAVFVKKDC